MIARVLLAALAGLLVAVSHPPVGWAFTAWFGLIPLLLALDGASRKASVGLGYITGLAMMLAGGTFATSFGEGVWLRLIPWIGFAVFEGLFLIPVALLIHRILERRSGWRLLVGVPAVWTLGEALRAWGPFGYPFTTLAGALAEWQFVIQTAEFGGQWMVTALAALVSVSLYLLFVKKDPRPCINGLSVVFVALCWGVSDMGSNPEAYDNPLRVSIVQTGVNHPDQDERAWQAFESMVLKTRTVIESGKPELIVWSESAIPGLPLENAGTQALVRKLTETGDCALLTGAQGLNEEGSPQNLSVMFLADGLVGGTYAKRHLVPFGEWVPGRGILPFLEDYGVVPTDTMPGDQWNVLSQGRVKVGTPICFESAFPGISRAFVRNGANVLAVITNDAWFGSTGLAEEHAAVASLRAVETRRWVIRAGLTGVSGFVDPTGRWADKLPMNVCAGTTELAGLHDNKTIYVRWGDWFLWLCGAVVALAVLPGRRTPDDI
ncbi:MAG TPA: apolipoprotein N-acyltransferase [Armatimonadota bacterium]|nr:apolipoprotein N-acyltransferase [Armatimonadota bacterium]